MLGWRCARITRTRVGTNNALTASPLCAGTPCMLTEAWGASVSWSDGQLHVGSQVDTACLLPRHSGWTIAASRRTLRAARERRPGGIRAAHKRRASAAKAARAPATPWGALGSNPDGLWRPCGISPRRSHEHKLRRHHGS